MPLILPPVAYERWLSEEPDPRDLMRPFPSLQLNACARADQGLAAR